MNKFKQILAGFALSMVAFSVMALPSVTGTLQMTGSFNAVDASGAVITDATQAAAIDFDFFDLDKFRVTLADGAYTGLTGVIGDIKDFQFDPFVSPIDDFWTVGIFSFQLTDVSRLPTDDLSSFLALEGSGIISAAGFEDTVASWKMSGDTSGGGSFSWSATTVSAVPEPGLLALLSLGLILLSVRQKLK